MGLGPRDVRSLDGHPIIVDGYRGRVFIDPLPAVIQEYRRLVRHEGRLSAKLADLRRLDATTTDGVRIGLGVNIGLLTDIHVPTTSASTRSGCIGPSSRPCRARRFRWTSTRPTGRC